MFLDIIKHHATNTRGVVESWPTQLHAVFVSAAAAAHSATSQRTLRGMGGENRNANSTGKRTEVFQFVTSALTELPSPTTTGDLDYKLPDLLSSKHRGYSRGL